jgi:lipid A ethanolaminephosphotransferase
MNGAPVYSMTTPNPDSTVSTPSPVRKPRGFVRPVVKAETLVVLGACFMMASGNGPFWRAAMSGRDWGSAGAWGVMAAFFGIFAAAYCLFTLLFSTRLTVKPLLSLLVLITAFASWYMDRYAIYLDRAMLRNVLATDPREAGELLTAGMIPHVVVFGLLPAVLIWWPRLEPTRWSQAFRRRLAWLAASLVVGLLCLWLVFADFASLMRNRPEVRYLVTPGNAVVSLISAAWGQGKRPNQAKVVVGADAHPGPAWAARKRPMMFVLVVGETARAQNFSLNGYARPTNPELAKKDIVNFPNATACGTSTAVSLPCMFSVYGRARYDEEKILTHESVLNVIQRAGFKVLWRDNQSGCKGVCDGVPSEQLDQAGIASLCPDGQCFDEVLLNGLDGFARDASGNVFVVMHQLGNHGPAYFKRYPPAFRRFTPACETEDLRKCSVSEIVNAYDNALLYTDFFLSKVIDFLDKRQDRYDTAMLYVSDHGESLGESGLYLHGMPYAIAPDVQTRVPFFVWLSPSYRQNFGVDQGCLRGRTGNAVSHDNLFHSLLGAMDIETAVYDVKLDFFAPCRAAVGAAGKPRETVRVP